MKQPMTRWPAWVVAAALMSVGLGSVLARVDDSKTDDKPRNAWVPPEVDRSAYRDIVDYNIFRADRRRIAQEVDRDRNPPPPRETTPSEPVRTVDKPPPNPDSFLRLAGITHAPDGVVAFIEHTQSGELSRLTGPAEFSKGEVTAIGLDAVMYVVAGEERVIRIGETLVGKRVAPAGSSSRSSSGSSSKSKSNLSAAERLRLLREQRAREQGTAPPADTPAPADTPEQPSDTPQPQGDTESKDDADADDADALNNLIDDDSDLSTDGRDTDADINP